MSPNAFCFFFFFLIIEESQKLHFFTYSLTHTFIFVSQTKILFRKPTQNPNKGNSVSHADTIFFFLPETMGFVGTKKKKKKKKTYITKSPITLNMTLSFIKLDDLD